MAALDYFESDPRFTKIGSAPISAQPQPTAQAPTGWENDPRYQNPVMVAPPTAPGYQVPKALRDQVAQQMAASSKATGAYMPPSLEAIANSPLGGFGRGFGQSYLNMAQNLGALKNVPGLDPSGVSGQLGKGVGNLSQYALSLMGGEAIGGATLEPLLQSGMTRAVPYLSELGAPALKAITNAAEFIPGAISRIGGAAGYGLAESPQDRLGGAKSAAGWQGAFETLPLGFAAAAPYFPEVANALQTIWNTNTIAKGHQKYDAVKNASVDSGIPGVKMRAGDVQLPTDGQYNLSKLDSDNDLTDLYKRYPDVARFHNALVENPSVENAMNLQSVLAKNASQTAFDTIGVADKKQLHAARDPLMNDLKGTLDSLGLGGAFQDATDFYRDNVLKAWQLAKKGDLSDLPKRIANLKDKENLVDAESDFEKMEPQGQMLINNLDRSFNLRDALITGASTAAGALGGGSLGSIGALPGAAVGTYFSPAAQKLARILPEKAISNLYRTGAAGYLANKSQENQ
jgi:hypothetical protein